MADILSFSRRLLFLPFAAAPARPARGHRRQQHEVGCRFPSSSACNLIHRRMIQSPRHLHAHPQRPHARILGVCTRTVRVRALCRCRVRRPHASTAPSITCATAPLLRPKRHQKCAARTFSVRHMLGCSTWCPSRLILRVSDYCCGYVATRCFRGRVRVSSTRNP